MLNSRVPSVEQHINDSKGENDPLHISASTGKLRTVRKLLKERNVQVDRQNNVGRTALFCAAYTGHFKIVNFLLKNGADPNHRCHGDYTPVHAACWSGSIKILISLLAAGGDLRLHDIQDRKPKDWAVMQPDISKGRQMLLFLDMLHQMICYFGDEDMTGHPIDIDSNCNTLSEILNKKLSAFIKQPNIFQKNPPKEIMQLLHLMGYGKISYEKEQGYNFNIHIPVIHNNSLKTFLSRGRYFNEASLIMERMMWGNVKVTRKKAKENCSSHGGDILISEMEYLSKLHHPNILLLMGVNPINDYTGINLIFENVEIGSLYHILHEKRLVPSQLNITDMLIQICEAIMYIHKCGFIHCAITSHSIHFINPRFAKLSNFGYMVPSDRNGNAIKKPMDFIHFQELYHWLAPEVITDGIPNVASDVYSYCTVVWELFTVQIPWEDNTTEQIAFKLGQKKETLKVTVAVEEPFMFIIKRGLRNSLLERRITFDEIYDRLSSKKHNLMLRTSQSSVEKQLKLAASLDSITHKNQLLNNSAYHKCEHTGTSNVHPLATSKSCCLTRRFSLPGHSMQKESASFNEDLENEFISTLGRKNFFQSVASIPSHHCGDSTRLFCEKPQDTSLSMDGDSFRQIHSARELNPISENSPIHHTGSTRSLSCQTDFAQSPFLNSSVKPASHMTPSSLNKPNTMTKSIPASASGSEPASRAHLHPPIPFTRYCLRQKEKNCSTSTCKESMTTEASAASEQSWMSTSVDETSSQQSVPCPKEWFAGKGGVQGLISAFESTDPVKQLASDDNRKQVQNIENWKRHCSSLRKDVNTQASSASTEQLPSFIVERRNSLGEEYGPLQILCSSQSSKRRSKESSDTSFHAHGTKSSTEIPSEDMYFDDDFNEPSCHEEHLKLYLDGSPRSLSLPNQQNIIEVPEFSQSEDHIAKYSNTSSSLSIQDGNESLKIITVKAEPGYSCSVRTESNCIGNGLHQVTFRKMHLESGKEEVMQEIVHAEAVQHHIVMDK